MTTAERIAEAFARHYEHIWEYRRQAEIHELEEYVMAWPGGAE